MTTDSLDLGICPSCAAPRRLGWRADEPGRLDALIDHGPGCRRLPVVVGGHEHVWARLPDEHGSVPSPWAVESCTVCQAVHVERDRDLSPVDRPVEPGEKEEA